MGVNKFYGLTVINSRLIQFAVLITIHFLLLPKGQLHSKEYYVAPNGDDLQSGTIESPFATIQKSQELAEPGDVVWLRGGTYSMQESQVRQKSRGRATVVHLDKSGHQGQLIRYWSFENEVPVFDFTALTPRGVRVTAFQVNGSYLHLRGIQVIGVQVTITGHTQSICFDNQGSHNVFEQLTMRDGQAIGFWLGRGSNNLVLNCDAYRNHDHTSEDGRGGNVDGFGFHVPKGSVGNIFRGCRAWFNSDDGFDLITTAEPVTIDSCWAFYNGFDPSFKSLADGSGFKAGGYARLPSSKIPSPLPRHTITHCLAVRNKAAGFYANHHPGGIDWISNTAYRNGANYNLLGRDLHNVDKDIDGHGHFMRNNLGYLGRREMINLNEAESDVSFNYFTLPVRVDASDFVSLDEAALILPRQDNGDLPESTFLRLANNSDLIDAGTTTDSPFKGKSPDLGAFESEQ